MGGKKGGVVRKGDNLSSFSLHHSPQSVSEEDCFKEK